MRKLPDLPVHVLSGNYRINRNSRQAHALIGWWPALGYNHPINKVNFGQNGSFQGSATITQIDQRGPVFSFDGSVTNDYISVPAYTEINNATTIGASCWAYFNTHGSGHTDIMFGKMVVASGAIQWLFYVQDGNLRFAYNQASGQLHRWTSSNDTIATGGWHHLAVTYASANGSSIKIWQDGRQLSGSWDTGSGNIAIQTGTRELRLGAQEHTSTSYFDGEMYDMRIYNRLLDGDDAWRLYAPETRWELFEDASSLPIFKAPAAVVDTGITESPFPAHIHQGVWRGPNPNSWQFQDLVAWWPFGQMATNQIEEMGSGSRWTGSIQGTPLWTTDPYFGNVVDFDGGVTNNYANVGTDTRFNPAGAFTIVAWVKGAAQDYKGIITKYRTSTNERSWALVSGGASNPATSNTDDVVFFYQRDATTFTSGDTLVAENVLDGEWHQIVCVFNPSTHARIYVDGVQAAEDTTGIQATIDGAGAELHIGNIEESTNEWDGQFGDIRLYDKALNSDEVWQLWSSDSRWDLYQEPLIALGPQLATGRISQLATEVLTQPNPFARVSKVSTEVLLTPSDPLGRISQVAAEVLTQPSPFARVSQVSVEVLLADEADPSESEENEDNQYNTNLVWIDLVEWGIP